MGEPGKSASNQPVMLSAGTVMREKLSGDWYSIPSQYGSLAR